VLSLEEEWDEFVFGVFRIVLGFVEKLVCLGGFCVFCVFFYVVG